MAKFTRFALLSAAIFFAATTVHAHGDDGDGDDDEVDVPQSVCDETFAANITATIDNANYWDTCAESEGATFNVTNLFDVLNFTDSDFLTFCNSSVCLEPIHLMIAEIPANCSIEYEGTAHNFSVEISSLHDKCHEALDAAELQMAGMGDDSTTTTSTSGSGSTAASVVGGSGSASSSSSAAVATTINSKILVTALTVATTVASLVL